MRLLLIILLTVSACDQSQPEVLPKANSPRTASPQSFVSLASPAHERGLHFRISAPRSKSLYLDNCNGAFLWGLEHQKSGTWKYAWGQEINSCHSEPIKIAAGTALEFREVVSVRRGEILPPGPYRLAVYGLYFSHGSFDHATSIEVPHIFRVSESFTQRFSVAP